MPPKEVRCEICDQTVLKSKTLAYKNGRACRDHDGVQEFSNDLRLQGKQKLEDSIKREEDKHKPRDYKKEDLDMKGTCWRCGCEGIDYAKFCFERMAALEKMNILGKEWDFFNLPNKIFENMPEKSRTPLLVLNIQERPDVIEKLKYKFRIVSHLAKMVQVCPSCLKDMKLEEEWYKIVKQFAEKISVEKSFLLGSLFQPVIQKIAEQRIAEEIK
jgi:hypothetical protein